MRVTDEDAAIAAITTLHSLSADQEAARAGIEQVLLNEDPFVDIQALFVLYNTLYFRSLLVPRVEVSWSKRLTLCAGICELVKDDEGKYKRIRLKLSEPLLKYRPKSDVVNTLLHEAIHSYFFITTSWKHSRGDDGTGHGAGFLLLSDAVNNHGGYQVTVYHTFHDEVDSYRAHVWQCDGPCRQQAPFFGLVKRSMNRAPSQTDTWWDKHQQACGGAWTKIAEPEMTSEQLGKLGALKRAGMQKNKIDNWIKRPPEAHPESTDVVETSRECNKRERTRSSDEAEQRPSQRTVVACPICDMAMNEGGINQHLDQSHSK